MKGANMVGINGIHARCGGSVDRAKEEVPGSTSEWKKNSKDNAKDIGLNGREHIGETGREEANMHSLGWICLSLVSSYQEAWRVKFGDCHLQYRNATKILRRSSLDASPSHCQANEAPGGRDQFLFDPRRHRHYRYCNKLALHCERREGRQSGE